MNNNHKTLVINDTNREPANEYYIQEIIETQAEPTHNTHDVDNNSGVTFSFDAATNSSYISGNSENLVLGTSNELESIILYGSGEIKLCQNVTVEDISAKNGNFEADIDAININLLGDIVATNSFVTNNLFVDKDIVADNIRASSLQSDKIVANDVCIEDKIVVSSIKSCGDICLVPEIEHVVTVPNIRYAVDTCNSATIEASSIKASKIFIVTKNIRLAADESCNGIEIIIYNNNTNNKIIIRDTHVIICTLAYHTAIKLCYLCEIDKWVLI